LNRPSGPRSRQIAAARDTQYQFDHPEAGRRVFVQARKEADRAESRPRFSLGVARSARSVCLRTSPWFYQQRQLCIKKKTFRSQACLTISVEEGPGPSASRPGIGGAPGGVSYRVTHVSCNNFIHLTHCSGLEKCRISLRSFGVLVLTTRHGEDQTNCTSLYWTFADLRHYQCADARRTKYSGQHGSVWTDV
jgi:hypothetical protein